MTDEHTVFCSDIEKTIIDCLFRPEYAGGIHELGLVFYVSNDEIDYDRLIEYAIRFDSKAMIQRLGFLLELVQQHVGLNVEPNHFKTLKKYRSNSTVLLDPCLFKEGKVSRHWRVQQNINCTDILNAIHW